LKEADTAFKYKTEYAPEMERIRRRVAPYGDLVMHAILAAVATLCLIAVFFVPLIFAARQRAPWYALILVLALLGVILPWWRFHIASASWAWHAIKTGEERPPRTPQLCDTLIKRLDRDIAKPETKVS
jgi:cytochrome c biogenesis protein CcdA